MTNLEEKQKQKEESDLQQEELALKLQEKKDKRKDTRWHRVHGSRFITRVLVGFLLVVVLFYVGEFVCSWGGCSFKAPQRAVDSLTSAVMIGLGYYLREWFHKGR